MAINKLFMVGTSNVFAYDITTSDLVYTSKTMLNTSVDFETSQQEIRSGYGNQLQYVYFNSSAMNLTMAESQFNLAMLASRLGTSVVTGSPNWTEENVTLGSGGTGTVSKTPLVTPDSTTTIYGWVTTQDGVTTRIQFTGSNFTLAGGTLNQVVCVRYYAQDNSAKKVTVSSNFIPSVVRLVIETQIASGDGTAAGSSIVGKVTFEIDRFQHNPTGTFDMTSDGVANTAISGFALSNNGTTAGCSNAGVYGRVIQQIFNTNWYDNVVQIAVSPDPLALTTANSPYQMVVTAIPTSGSAFTLNPSQLADLTWTSSAVGTFTVNTTGAVTKVAAGSATLTAKITAKQSVIDTVAVTVS